jgi:adenosylcobinamide-GDP ribazoletransferase
LTVIPLPGRDCESKTKALPLFFLVGLCVAALHVLLAALFDAASQRLTLLLGLALCVLNYGITGAFHLDGLADTADAFGMLRNRERTLAVLKDPHVGVYGAAAVVLAVLWRALVYSGLAESENLAALFACFAASRALQGVMLSFLPYGRDGTGTGAPFTGHGKVGILCSAEYVLAMGLGCLWVGPVAGLAAGAGALAVVAGVCTLYLRRIGGITGDAVGAATELFEIIFLGIFLGVL